MDEQHPDVDFEFVDPTHFYEGEAYGAEPPSEADRETREKRHTLCSPGQPWLNGVTLGTQGDGVARPLRSFHPNQEGHNRMTIAVATRIGPMIDDGRLPVPEPEPEELSPIDEAVQFVEGAIPVGMSPT